jgi:hypothetical protein
MPCMSRSQLFIATMSGQSCWDLIAQALPYWFICVQVVPLSLPVTPMAATSGRSRRRTAGPHTGKCHMCWLLLRAMPYGKVSPVYHRVYCFRFYVYYSAAKLCIEIWTQIVIFLYSEHLIYGLYVCTCEFSLHRESFGEILYDTRISMMGVLHLVSESC